MKCSLASWSALLALCFHQSLGMPYNDPSLSPVVKQDCSLHKIPWSRFVTKITLMDKADTVEGCSAVARDKSLKDEYRCVCREGMATSEGEAAFKLICSDGYMKVEKGLPSRCFPDVCLNITQAVNAKYIFRMNSNRDLARLIVAKERPLIKFDEKRTSHMLCAGLSPTHTVGLLKLKCLNGNTDIGFKYNYDIQAVLDKPWMGCHLPVCDTGALDRAWLRGWLNIKAIRLNKTSSHEFLECIDGFHVKSTGRTSSLINCTNVGASIHNEGYGNITWDLARVEKCVPGEGFALDDRPFKYNDCPPNAVYDDNECECANATRTEKKGAATNLLSSVRLLIMTLIFPVLSQQIFITL